MLTEYLCKDTAIRENLSRKELREYDRQYLHKGISCLTGIPMESINSFMLSILLPIAVCIVTANWYMKFKKSRKVGRKE